MKTMFKVLALASAVALFISCNSTPKPSGDVVEDAKTYQELVKTDPEAAEEFWNACEEHYENQVKESVAGAVSAFGDMYKDVADDVLDAYKEVADEVVNAYGDDVLEAYGETLEKAAEAYGEAYEQAAEAYGEAYEQAAAAYGDAYEQAAEQAAAAMEAAAAEYEKALEGLF